MRILNWTKDKVNKNKLHTFLIKCGAVSVMIDKTVVILVALILLILIKVVVITQIKFHPFKI